MTQDNARPGKWLLPSARPALRMQFCQSGHTQASGTQFQFLLETPPYFWYSNLNTTILAATATWLLLSTAGAIYATRAATSTAERQNSRAHLLGCRDLHRYCGRYIHPGDCRLAQYRSVRVDLLYLKRRGPRRETPHLVIDFYMDPSPTSKREPEACFDSRTKQRGAWRRSVC